MVSVLKEDVGDESFGRVLLYMHIMSAEGSAQEISDLRSVQKKSRLFNVWRRADSLGVFSHLEIQDEQLRRSTDF